MIPSAFFHRWLAPGCAAISLLLGGCCARSTDEQHYTNRPKFPDVDHLAGDWVGTWQSAHGHHGRLLCQFIPLGGHHYLAHFTAYWAALHGSYDVDFLTKREGKVLHFEGSKDLGVLYGGLYHYSATASGSQFHADYTAKADKGTFELSR